MAENHSLLELQLLIRDSLYLALPEFYWITAEISEIKENSAGHCYLELIEKHPDEKNVRARAKAIIWSNRYRFLKPLFETTAGESLKEGMKILVRAKVEYHELYGLSLIISDIDPSYTIGEMSLKKQNVIRRLKEEGIFNMNRETGFPLVPYRIAVISSRNAAGYQDFIRHLQDNSYGYIFYTALFEAVMQGPETEESVIHALDKIAEHPGLFDVAAILRGGGSQSDLSWFDSYNIAYHVTQFPIAVITGIGHEKDLSVTDMVACRSLKTPTAVADNLINSVAEFEEGLNGMSTAITNYTKEMISRNRTRLDALKTSLFPVTKLMISDKKKGISERIIRLINSGRENTARAGIIPGSHRSKLMAATHSYTVAKYTAVERKKAYIISATKTLLNKINLIIDNQRNLLSILDPRNILKRGFSITKFNGKILKAREQVSSDDIIDTILAKGSLISKVIKGNH